MVRKWYITILYLFIFMLVLFVLYFIGGRVFSDKYILDTIVIDKDVVFELKTDIKTGYLDLYKDNKFVKTVTELSVKRKVLNLPDVTIKTRDSKSADICADNVLKYKSLESALTYSCTFEESSSYMMYLKEEGYKTTREVRTPDYIEFFMQDNAAIKRLVITNSTLMISTIDKGAELPVLSSYFSKYKNIDLDVKGEH